VDTRSNLESLSRGRCVNGCDATVHAPSVVLCRACSELVEHRRALRDLVNEHVVDFACVMLEIKIL
jgi:hypothetical protein